MKFSIRNLTQFLARLSPAAVAAVISATALSTLNAGSVTRLFYDGISTTSSSLAVRTSVSTLTNSSIFPDSPTFREQLDDFTALAGFPLKTGLQGKDNSGTDYGSFTRGYIEVPATGAYLFNVASDDASSLYLSTDTDPANLQLIAFETESGAPLFGGPRQEQRLSAPIQLVRGQKYYFELLHKQGSGASYIQVGWQRPDGTQEIIPALSLAQYPYDAFLGTGSLTQTPVFNTRGFNGGNTVTNITVAEGTELLLQLDTIAAQPTTIQWTRNGTVIPGENLSYLRIPRTPATFNGAKIQAVVQNAYGSLSSAVTTVKVTADITAPYVLNAETGGNPNLLHVTFSEPVNPTAAANLANYTIRAGGATPLTIQSATVSADQTAVDLKGVFNFVEGTSYQVIVQNIRDQATVPNEQFPDPAAVPFVFSAPTGTTYTFNSGRPSGFSFFGNADVTTSGSYDGTGYLRLTDGVRNQNGAVVITERRNIDQVHLTFNVRLSDGGSTSGLDAPGDGFSINIAADLPQGTLGSPEEGFTPDVPGNRLSFTFDSHADSITDQPSIAVLLNNTVVTNVLVGVGDIPPLTSIANFWATVDIDIRRNGVLTLTYAGVPVIDHLPTAFEGVPNAQIGIAARTRAWYQSHWIDDLTINFGEGDIGNVGLSDGSILGGAFPEGADVKLSALPTGAGPFAYQWFKDGSALAGETGRVLRFAAIAGAGGSYSVKVSNAFSDFTSAPQTVTIIPDTTAPSVVSAVGVAGGVNQITLTFSETLDPVTATDPSIYSSPLYRIRDVLLGADGKTVTLKTTQQRVGITYPLTINGLKDRSIAGNRLQTTIHFTSRLTYQDEILADNPVRYYKFEETSGTIAATQTTSGDQLNTNGVFQNFPILGVPSLVPSAPNEFAAHFVRANTNYVLVPNGGDLNDYRGPWPKKSYEFWFRADSTPTVAPAGANDATVQLTTTAGLWEEGGNLRSIAVYLWRDPTKLNPGEAELTFHAYNDTPDGPGAPFGLRQHPPVYITSTIKTNTTYHVVAVMDGNTETLDGELRLYVNGALASRSTNGVGQIYNHNGDIQIARGNARTHLNISANLGSLDGTLDEVSTFNTALSEDRIKAHYLAGTGASLVVANPATVISTVDAHGNPNRLYVQFNQPVSQDTATVLANYNLKSAGGTALTLKSARLFDDLVTVQLDGTFNFQAGAPYTLTAQKVADILAPDNVLALVSVPFTFVTAGPAGIAATSDLSNRQVGENLPFQFGVTPIGQPPFTYQWLFNGSPIPGKTNAVLTGVAPLGAAGSYSVTVANEFSTTTSTPVTLTVIADHQAPSLISARALAGTLNQIRLTFSEPVDPTTATNLANYSLSGTGVPSLVGASLSDDGKQVTLRTTTQVNGQPATVSLRGIRDRAAAANSLTTDVAVASGISYRDEILSDSAVRYWTFDETPPTPFGTLVSHFDTAQENLGGVYLGNPTLGVPGLVPNVAGDLAVKFRGSELTNRIELPNARDLNAILGPWAKRTHLFTFRADTLPRVDGTNVESPAIYSHDRIAIYLYGTQDTNRPTEAQLVFRAHNTTSEGPGTPWGGITLDTSKHIITTIQAGKVYHVAAVLDGSTDFTGQLRLYINGQLAGAVGGIGQIYKHPNTPPVFGQGSFRTHVGFSQNLDITTVNYNARFDGVVDEFGIVSKALTSDRIAQLYAFSQVPAVLNPAPPAQITGLEIQGGNVLLHWSGAGNLQRADSVGGPFSPVSGATSPYSEPIAPAGQKFFRLVP